MGAASDAPGPEGRRGARGLRLFGWLVSLAVLGAVVTVALHASEERAFIRMAENAEPVWLLLAMAMQGLTYLFQGEVFRAVGRAARVPIPAGVVYRLSLAKLFIDQAIPSTGLSGTYVFAQGLQARGVPRRVVMSGVVVDLVSYYAAYVLCIALALIVAVRAHHAERLVVAIALVFVFYAMALSVALLRMSGRGLRHVPPRLARMRLLNYLASFPADADPRITHHPRTLGTAVACQLAIMLADTTTVALLIHALGHHTPFVGVFASFMIANLFRTFGIVPGGLGVFEAGSVLTLQLAGVPVAVALGATLLFRGLSFWLPMVPGLLFARAARRQLAATTSAPAGAPYWTRTADDLLKEQASGPQGLSSTEADRRLTAHGPNQLTGHQQLSRLRVLLDQLRNPLLLVLFFAAVVSAFTGEWTDAGIVLAILGASVGIGYAREYRARSAAEALRSRIATRATVLRNGQAVQLASSAVVPGDVVLLGAGSLIPADGVVLESTDLFVSEAALTGESFPVEKRPGLSAADTPLAKRGNVLHLGGNVRSGSARMLVVRTGRGTAYGAIAQHLDLKPRPTAFEQGITRFGYMLTVMMVVLVAVVFTVHMLGGRPLIGTLLFSIALAVGLSPELLPAILSVNLSRGAHLLAQQGVLVRRLNAIENLGSMDVLCTDKTGTLTEGVLRLEGAFAPDGTPSDRVLEQAALNATLASGYDNPLDQAIAEAHRPDASGLTKVGEVPFDFQRKRLSVALRQGAEVRLVMKGAFHHVLEVCDRLADGNPLDDARRAALEARYAAWSDQGIRVLAMAQTVLAPGTVVDRNAERNMAFTGFLTFLDRPKEGVARTVQQLAALGVRVKLISGDNRLVSQHVAGQVGLNADAVVTGAQLEQLHGAELHATVQRADVFAEVDPDQKETIIQALQQNGHAVGFLGDGVNDAQALHTADVGISVDSAVDVAREAADLVLLQRDLDVIRRGIDEGRRTFANTLKYILITMSANLGNMLSMAAASLYLPFLPLLAGQVLLNNFLSDIPAVGMADDRVDPEDVARPRRWSIRSIVRYMVTFGALSSLFDLATFATLLYGFHAGPEVFRTGWFVESLLTELVIALVMRTRRPFWRSRPGTLLRNTSLVLLVFALALPYLPGTHLFGFVPLPLHLLPVLAAIVLAYVLATELFKRRASRWLA